MKQTQLSLFSNRKRFIVVKHCVTHRAKPETENTAESKLFRSAERKCDVRRRDECGLRVARRRQRRRRRPPPDTAASLRQLVQLPIQRHCYDMSIEGRSESKRMHTMTPRLCKGAQRTVIEDGRGGERRMRRKVPMREARLTPATRHQLRAHIDRRQRRRQRTQRLVSIQSIVAE